MKIVKYDKDYHRLILYDEVRKVYIKVTLEDNEDTKRDEIISWYLFKHYPENISLIDSHTVMTVKEFLIKLYKINSKYTELKLFEKRKDDQKLFLTFAKKVNGTLMSKWLKRRPNFETYKKFTFNLFYFLYETHKFFTHYDLHPGNIFIKGENFVLIDFEMSFLNSNAFPVVKIPDSFIKDNFKVFNVEDNIEYRALDPSVFKPLYIELFRKEASESTCEKEILYLLENKGLRKSYYKDNYMLGNYSFPFWPSDVFRYLRQVYYYCYECNEFAKLTSQKLEREKIMRWNLELLKFFNVKEEETFYHDVILRAEKRFFNLEFKDFINYFKSLM